jgi:hypothetical protein
MSALASPLLVASAGVVLMLGVIHVVLTLFSNKFQPREPMLESRLKEVSPILTRQTTMWKAWVGFNLSHSFGLIFFGLIYGYLALVHGPLLFASPFLLTVGAALLGGYLFLCRRYWFSAPFRGVLLATVLYGLALCAHGTGGAHRP